MKPPREFLLDECVGSRRFVDDELVRQDSKVDVLAGIKGNERSLTCVDRTLAERAGRRICVELLNSAGEEVQELVDRSCVGGPGDRTCRLAPRRGSAATQSRRALVRTVIACACVDSHGFSGSLANG
jgi:hypothetical protein